LAPYFQTIKKMENLQPYQIAQEAIQRTGRMNVLFTSRHSKPVRAWLTAREPHPQVTQYDFYLNTSYGFKCTISFADKWYPDIQPIF
jgi:hypothetical protein